MARKSIVSDLMRRAMRIPVLGEETKQEEEIIQETLEHFSKAPANFLMGLDPFTGQPIWMTQDEHDEENPFKGLPDKSYIRYCLDLYQNEEIVVIEKGRQMMVSTFTCGYIAWESLAKLGRLWMVSKKKEKDAVVLLRDKIRGPWSRMPDWLRMRWPMSLQPQEEITCTKSGSHVLGVTENVAVSAGRGNTASGFFLDEAAFQDLARDVWGAVIPMSKKFIAVTTPGLGPGGIFIKGKLDEAEEGELLKEYMYEYSDDFGLDKAKAYRGADRPRKASVEGVAKIQKAVRKGARDAKKESDRASNRNEDGAPF